MGQLVTADMADWVVPSDCCLLSAYVWHWWILHDILRFWESCLKKKIQASQFHLTSNRGDYIDSTVEELLLLTWCGTPAPCWLCLNRTPGSEFPDRGHCVQGGQGKKVQKKRKTPETISFFFWLIFIFWKLSIHGELPTTGNGVQLPSNGGSKKGWMGSTTHLVP